MLSKYLGQELAVSFLADFIMQASVGCTQLQAQATVTSLVCGGGRLMVQRHSTAVVYRLTRAQELTLLPPTPVLQ